MKYETRKTFMLLQLEVIYKFFRLSQRTQSSFFFNNNLT